MKRFSQIFGAILFTTALIAFCIVAAIIGKDGFSAARSALEKSEKRSVNLSAYSKMALLSMNEPDRRLAMPVKGVSRKQIADTWRSARSGGREHSGQDIFARRGTPVYSATEGYVLQVGENRLGGKVVFVYGNGGRRYYYAHLDDFAPNLKAGDYVTTACSALSAIPEMP
ncbi:MAG TPA: M23 family metallopeptidase [Pyrinomonadaceae bacterium]|jgi:murein DD-endopeptidase MepM/ murein hydrolase activator NlpD